MGAFVATNSLVWLALVLYVAWLAVRQRSLVRTINALQVRLDRPEAIEAPARKTAA